MLSSNSESTPRNVILIGIYFLLQRRKLGISVVFIDGRVDSTACGLEWATGGYSDPPRAVVSLAGRD